ncbi:MAG: hypothetical protein R3F45_14630 [Gammaproteobacteria bacterium]
MHNEMMSGDAGQDLRREINALHGLLHFSFERRYPEGITRSLQQLLNGRELALSVREAAARVAG